MGVVASVVFSGLRVGGAEAAEFRKARMDPRSNAAVLGACATDKAVCATVASTKA